MSTHYPVLILILPLTASLLSAFVSKLQKNLGQILVTLSILLSGIISVLMFVSLINNSGQPIHYWLGGWPAPIGIELVVDYLNITVAIIICILSFATALFAHSFVKDLGWIRIGGFYALIGLLTVGLLGMTVTGDIFNLYVFLEISSLSGYGLIALGGNKGVIAAFRYLLVGTVGASLYLLGIGILYALTGTLNMEDLSNLIQPYINSPLILISLSCIFVAFAIKMALFPLHGWQTDAYTFSHTAAAPLISGAMSKVPAYAMIRFFFYIFSINQVFANKITFIAGICGAFAMIYGSYKAIKQTDLRKMFAYSSVAQLGYVALGIGIGNAYALSGAALHIINHALMKAGLFFIVGACVYRLGTFNLRDVASLHRKMPWCAFTLIIASLSMVGIPPTGGFFSKYYLMVGAWQERLYIYLAVLLISTLLNAVYFLRVIEIMFTKKSASLTDTRENKRLELPVNMLIPIILFGVAIIAMGILNGTLVGDVFLDAFGGVSL